MKLAFIGTGKIVQDALDALTSEDNILKTAVFARPHSREKAEALARQHGIEEVWTDYEELLKNTKADTVYIGLINSAHYSYAKEALLAKKHVILEKPFTAFADEAEDLRDIAARRQVFIFEAITVLHNDIIRQMEKNLPKLGNIRMVLCNYSQYSSRYDDYLKGKANHSFDPAYYGGALHDINVYNVHYCVRLFGMPQEVHYYPNRGFNGIDISGALILTYPGFSAVCTGAKDSDSPGFVQIQGERGWMKIDGKPNSPTKLVTVFVDAADQSLTKDPSGAMVRAMLTETYAAKPYQNRMTQEFQEFAQIIDGADPAKQETYAAWLEETVNTVKVLELARQQSGLLFKR